MASGSDKEGKGRPGDPVDEPPVSDQADPLMNPAAALAAATAFGFGMAAQMSRFFLGSLQGAMDLTGDLARQLEDERKAEEAKAAKEPAAQPEPVTTPEVVTEKVKAAPATPALKKAKASPVKAPAKAGAKAEVKDKPVTAKPVVKAAPKTKSAERSTVADPVKAVKAAKAEAPEKTVKPAPARKGGKADDLKRIDGIGPKLEQVLKGRGITRFQQVVELEPEALAALDTDLGLDGRTLRDDWTGQAKRLLGGKVRTGK
jgi:NADH-quinone oxidoreductase subunit E